MRFYPNTLGFKLQSGQIKKHSEQLNKFVAGLFDADGYISFDFCRNKIQLQCGIVLIDENLIYSLQKHYKMGTIIVTDGKLASHSTFYKWAMRSKESKKFFNLIGKHLRIKATHFRNLVNIHTELEEETLQEDMISSLKEISKESRKNSKWLRHPKHPSYAWVSGYLAGDGHFEFKKGTKRNPREVVARASSVCHKDDCFIQYFLKTAFGGSVTTSHGGDHYIWRVSLGRGSAKFAVDFLKKLRLYMCMERKFIVIDDLIKFHEQPAETKCCEV